jgi:uncharacterized membrane protein YfcA
VSVLGLLLAVLIGVSLGFFGGGGSILTVPLLVYVFALEPKVAIASSLLVVAAASLSGAIQHAHRGNVRTRTALVFGAAGMAGAFLGGQLAAFVDGGVLLLLFAMMMAVTSIAMWRGRRTPVAHGTTDHPVPKLLLQGFAVGSFTGLVGAGGGFLIVPALALWAGLPMTAAVGSSLVVIVMNSLAGFTGYASHVSVDPVLVGSVGACAIAGSFVGSRLAHRVDAGQLRRAFAGFVFVMAVLILVREARLLLETASAALPRTLPQLLFAVLMLGVGAAAGRVNRGSVAAEAPEPTLQDGEGI